MTAQHYDAIVIGAGQGGIPLAKALARAGRKTALIEREHVGGTCINVGCTPTKTMVASARVAYLARRAEDFGVSTGPVSVDMIRVRARKRKIVESWRASDQRRLEQTPGLALIMGEARFSDPRVLDVRLNAGGALQLEAETIVINSGARPSRPPIDGLERVPALTSTSIMELDSVPSHLLVLGGGYVGLEFGQMFRRFGSRVTIVQRNTQLLPQEDPDIADEVTKILREDGVEVLLEAETDRVDLTADNQIRMAIRTPSERDGRSLIGSHLLIATGRVPNTEHLNLAVAGIRTGAGGVVQVNERLETTAHGVYAMGDVKGGPAFTHISYDDFRILQANLLHGGTAAVTGRLVPYTVFIDPQLGRVGITETEARRLGRAIRVVKLPMDSVARALEVDEPRGLIKAIVDAESRQLLGAAVLGLDGGEIMAILEVAMLGRLDVTVLRETTFAHPTLAESLNNLFAGIA